MNWCLSSSSIIKYVLY